MDATGVHAGGCLFIVGFRVLLERRPVVLKMLNMLEKGGTRRADGSSRSVCEGGAAAGVGPERLGPDQRRRDGSYPDG